VCAAALLLFLPILGVAAENGHAAPSDKPIISQFIWALLSFIIVLAILLKKLFPPIVAAMDRRAEEIRNALHAAENARAEAQEMIKQHHADMESARKEAAAIIAEGKADAQRVKEAIMASAKKEAEEVAGRALRDIDRAKRQALDELKQQSVDLSIGIAKDLIGRELDANAHQDLIQERIRSFTAR
jgi:F-type H+-transporting ATPase subunit b